MKIPHAFIFLLVAAAPLAAQTSEPDVLQRMDETKSAYERTGCR